VVEHYLDTVGRARNASRSDAGGVTGEEPIKLKFFYTYVLRCSDSELYVGYAKDLRVRLGQHKMGKVPATAYRLPVELVCYEACLDISLAQARERQLKTGFGRAYLKRRLGLS
jgi:putative endonuclease